MELYRLLRVRGENFQAKIINPIHMGDVLSTDTLELVDIKYLDIRGNQVYIKEGSHVEIRYVESNGWIEITFDDTVSTIDIAFDEFEKYDEYFKIF